MAQYRSTNARRSPDTGFRDRLDLLLAKPRCSWARRDHDVARTASSRARVGRVTMNANPLPRSRALMTRAWTLGAVAVLLATQVAAAPVLSLGVGQPSGSVVE